MGRSCAIEPAPPTALNPTDYAATYTTVEGVLSAVWVIPISTAAHVAAAMGGFPRSRAQECAKAGALDAALAEVLVEVGNVLGVLVNGPGSVRLRFSGISAAGDLPADVRGFLEDAPRRAGFGATVDDDGPHVITVALAS